MTSRDFSWVVGALALAFCGACDRLPNDDDAITSSAMTTRAITFCDWSANGYASPVSRLSLQELAETGANTAVFLVTAYQQTSHSSIVGARDGFTPTDLSVLQGRAFAAEFGLNSAIKLHVDVLDGSWRGFIEPENPELWFEAYELFALIWADFAETYGFTELVIGTELAMLSKREREWRRLIQRVRSVYSGKLMYGASWDEAENIEFWDDLDAVGIDFYYPVAQRRDCGRLELLAGWQSWLARLSRIHERTGLPIVLTEIGYMSRDGAGMDPPQFEGEHVIDLQEQADLYWAALAATAQQRWITGVYWWNWPAFEEGGVSSSGYTPRGKPAADILRESWAFDANR